MKDGKPSESRLELGLSGQTCFLKAYQGHRNLMVELLKHPLTILLVGALISGLLIPRFTLRWQNHQKALEIKTQLVSELSKSIMEIIMAIQYAHLGAESLKQADFDKAYLDWEIESAVIGTKLQAYFSDTTIPTEWTTFSALITDFYALEGVAPNERSKFTEVLARKLGAPTDLKHQDLGDWLALKNRLLERKSALIQQVLLAKVSVLG
jgi:hypothetical protein